MKSIYHYTKIDSFKQIVKNGDLNFRASRYSNFDNRDYEWIRKYAELAIKEMCESKEFTYDPDLLEFIPYIISFSNTSTSTKLWTRYAGCDGVEIELNRKVVEKYAIRPENPDTYGDCIYFSEGEERDTFKLKEILICLLNKKNYQMVLEEDKDVNGENYQYDLLECVCLLKQKEYEEEKEFRYIMPNYNVILCSYNNGDFQMRDDIENEESVEMIQDKKYMYCAFPKEALLGVTFGLEVRDDIIREVRHLLKDKDFDVSKVPFRRLKIVNTRKGPKLWRYKCDSLFK